MINQNNNEPNQETEQTELTEAELAKITEELTEIKTLIDEKISFFEVQAESSSTEKMKKFNYNLAQGLDSFKAHLLALSTEKQKKAIDRIKNGQNNSNTSNLQNPKSLFAGISRIMEELETEKQEKQELLAEIKAMFPSNGQPFGVPTSDQKNYAGWRF